MIIDFHTHIFPDKIAGRTIDYLESTCDFKAFTRGTANELVHEMKKGAVDLSVALPVVTKPEQFKSINEFAYEINQKYFYNCEETKPRIFSFGGIHPECIDYKQKLKDINSMGLKGIKLHPDYQKAMVDDMNTMHIIDCASELGLITTIHCGVDVGFPDPVHATPQALKNMLDEVKPENVILAHLGGFDMWEDVEKYIIGKNVYFDTAFLDGKIQKEQFIRIVRAHGTDRVLFATDSPWSSEKIAIQWLKDTELTDEELEKILHKNAECLLGGK